MGNPQFDMKIWCRTGYSDITRVFEPKRFAVKRVFSFTARQAILQTWWVVRPGYRQVVFMGASETLNTYRSTIHKLASGQKPATGVSYYTRGVNRPTGKRLAAVAHLLHLSPNQVSLISGAVTASGIILIATVTPSWSVGLAIWLLLTLGFMLDAADGQLARLRGTSSPAGEWLDHILDAGKMVAVHSAVLISWYRYFDVPPTTLFIPLVFQFAAVVTFVGGTLAALLLRTSNVPKPARSPSNLRSVLLLPADYGIFCLIFIGYGSPTAFIVLYSSLAAIRLCFLGAFSFKWFKELS